MIEWTYFNRFWKGFNQIYIDISSESNQLFGSFGYSITEMHVWLKKVNKKGARAVRAARESYWERMRNGIFHAKIGKVAGKALRMAF